MKGPQQTVQEEASGSEEEDEEGAGSEEEEEEGKTNEPHREKTCLWGFRQSEFQTSLLSFRDYLENWIFARSTSRYDSFQ